MPRNPDYLEPDATPDTYGGVECMVPILEEAEIACRVPDDPVDEFVGPHGRDAHTGDGVDDRRMSLALAHAGLETTWRP